MGAPWIKLYRYEVLLEGEDMDSIGALCHSTVYGTLKTISHEGIVPGGYSKDLNKLQRSPPNRFHDGSLYTQGRNRNRNRHRTVHNAVKTASEDYELDNDFQLPDHFKSTCKLNGARAWDACCRICTPRLCLFEQH